MAEDNLEVLLQTTDNSTVSLEQSTKYTITKRKINSICRALTLETRKYDPHITVDNISQYLASTHKLERILYSEISNYIFSLEMSQRGIFAAIVLAFVGGITFSTSVLENISEVSAYRLLLVIDFLAFTLINVIYILVKFIFTINDKDAKLFNIKVINISCAIIAAVITIGWLANVSQIPEFLADFLPWSK